MQDETHAGKALAGTAVAAVAAFSDHVNLSSYGTCLHCHQRGYGQSIGARCWLMMPKSWPLESIDAVPYRNGRNGHPALASTCAGQPPTQLHHKQQFLTAVVSYHFPVSTLWPSSPKSLVISSPRSPRAYSSVSLITPRTAPAHNLS